VGLFFFLEVVMERKRTRVAASVARARTASLKGRFFKAYSQIAGKIKEISSMDDGKEEAEGHLKNAVEAMEALKGALGGD